MNYPQRNKPQNSLKSRIAIVAIVVICLYGLSFMNSGIQSALYYTSRPLWLVRDTVGGFFTRTIHFFTLQSRLTREVTSLQEELNIYKLKEIDYEMVKRENDELKASFGREQSSGKILSRVLSKPPFTAYDTFIIDAGTNSNIVIGSKVYASQNIIIGTVTDVTASHSVVTLFSGSGRKQEAVNTRTGNTFDLEGAGGMNMKVNVPKEADILWGDMFEYPALSSSLLGSVYYIDVNSQSSFKTIYIKSPGNIFSTKWVYVDITI